MGCQLHRHFWHRYRGYTIMPALGGDAKKCQQWPNSWVLLQGVDPALVCLGSLPWRNRGHCTMDVDPLPHWLGPGGSVQLGPPQCCLSFIASFARHVVGLRPQPHLVDACTYSSCGCGSIFRLIVLRWCLCVTGSQVNTHVGSLSGHTVGTTFEFRMQGWTGVQRVHQWARQAHGL
jgi:hypothetical protein